MRGNLRPGVAICLPGSGCGVSLTTSPNCGSCWWSCIRRRTALVGSWKPGFAASAISAWLTGHGASDYDLCFTSFIYTFETSAIMRQKPPSAGTSHREPPTYLTSPKHRLVWPENAHRTPRLVHAHERLLPCPEAAPPRAHPDGDLWRPPALVEMKIRRSITRSPDPPAARVTAGSSGRAPWRSWG